MLILANYFWFLNITFSSKNNHQSGLNQPTDMFDHSTESLKWGEKDRTWVGGLRRLWRPKKSRNILLPNSVATVVFHENFDDFIMLCNTIVSYIMGCNCPDSMKYIKGTTWFIVVGLPHEFCHDGLKLYTWTFAEYGILSGSEIRYINNSEVQTLIFELSNVA